MSRDEVPQWFPLARVHTGEQEMQRVEDNRRIGIGVVVGIRALSGDMIDGCIVHIARVWR